MNIQDYWHDIDSRLEYLLEHGFVKLPSLKDFGLDHVATDISNEMGSLTFKELGSQHKNFLEVLSVDDDGNNITPTIRAQGLVTGVDLSGNEVIVEMGGIRVPLSSVLSLREDGTV